MALEQYRFFGFLIQVRFEVVRRKLCEILSKPFDSQSEKLGDTKFSNF